MSPTTELSDDRILNTLGERVTRHRIAAGLTQAELAEQSGIGKRTLERVESGRGVELVNLIRVLRALDLLEGLDRLIPELPPSPIAQVKLRGKQRQRVAHSRGSGKDRGASSPKPWTWGDT